MDGEIDERQREALNELYTMPERSQFLAYPIKEVVEVGEKVKYEVQERLNMKTLQDFIHMPLEERPELSELLQYLLDSMKGLRFLLDHGFVLSDFRPSNIGVNLDTNSGMLFDYDSLYRKGDKIPYIAHPKWIPKEIVSWNTPVEYEEPLMIFEFGQTILSLIGDELPELRSFAGRMIAPRYGDVPRPSLDDAIVELGKYV